MGRGNFEVRRGQPIAKYRDTAMSSAKRAE